VLAACSASALGMFLSSRERCSRNRRSYSAVTDFSMFSAAVMLSFAVYRARRAAHEHALREMGCFSTGGATMQHRRDNAPAPWPAPA
jgi:hypothetical protein